MFASFLPRAGIFCSSLLLGGGAGLIGILARPLPLEQAIPALSISVGLGCIAGLFLATSTALVLLDLRAHDFNAQAERRFWLITVTMSLGLLMPLWWIRERCSRPADKSLRGAPRPIHGLSRPLPTTSNAPESPPIAAEQPTLIKAPLEARTSSPVLHPFRAETAPTMLVDCHYPLAPRPRADLSFIHVSLEKVEQGTLAPSRQVLLRAPRRHRPPGPLRGPTASYR
ncbi:MAG: hypothetical protein CL927_01380 [Deltaproteobacteria bacterium]|nr:hypothetical protein [Deltaproteobacteria bacterium]HCH62502.1 hypothetical protein [Deltaproteobacteria bacterium]